MFAMLKNLHMNKKLLALLFAVPAFCAADTVYDVMTFAPSLDQVAVDSKETTGHDVALRFTSNALWYASAKTNNIGVAQNTETKFRIIKTGTEGLYKLYCVKNQKFVAYKNASKTDDRTFFTDDDQNANTNWRIVQNIGKNGSANNYDIIPGSENAGPNAPAWNAFGGASENALIGFWDANDGGSCWTFETVAQQIKFFDSYEKSNDSYFMTLRGRFVHKDGELFSADDKLQFGQDEYLFQLVGTPDNFKIYNVKSGTPIGTNPGANDDNNRYRTNFQSTFSAKTWGGRVYVNEPRKANLYLNFRDGFLSTWSSAAAWNRRDAGSQILFTTEDGILAEAAKKLAEEIKATYTNDKFGTGLNQYPESEKKSVADVIEDLKEAQNLENKDIAKKKSLYYSATLIPGMLQLNMPQNGDLLYLSFARDSKVKYLTSSLHEASEKGWQTYGSLGGHLTGKDEKGYDALFYVKLNAQGEATLVSVATGRRVAWGKRDDNKTYPTIASKNGEGAAFTITSRDGKYVFEQGGRFLACDANGNYAEAYSKYNSTFTTVRLERVTTLPFTIGPSGFSSFWSPVQYTLPEGVTACRLEVEGGKVKLSPVEGNTVPKNTAVILKGAANETVQLTLVPEGTAAPLTGNLLTGGAEPTALTTPVYALKKSAPSFIKVSDYMPAFKAYFTATENQVRELLERGLTGVVSVATEAEDAPVYDLSGRRVQQTAKGGVYVTNGKKFIAK